MIAVRLDPRGSRPESFAYRVAGRLLIADRPLGWLEPFTIAGPAPVLPPSLHQGSPVEPGEPIFVGKAFLARKERQLTCHHFPWGFSFVVEALGCFQFVEAEPSLEVQASEPGAPSELLEEVLLGPLLALVLARQGIFLLHAGACELEGKVFLLLGESGAGKSTLAAKLGGSKLADDQAAVDAGSLELLPDFPQPKMDQEAQELLSQAGRKPVAGILLLEKAHPQAEPELHLLDRLPSAAGILSHTTASRCFDASLLRAHLGFASALAAEVPVQRLVYPHHPEASGRIRALLTRS